MSQHIATRWRNARNMLRPTMLRHVVLACCDRLAGALKTSVVPMSQCCAIKQMLNAITCSIESRMHLGGLVSTDEARVARGNSLVRLLRFFRA